MNWEDSVASLNGVYGEQGSVQKDDDEKWILYMFARNVQRNEANQGEHACVAYVIS